MIKTGESVRRETFLSRRLDHPYILKPYDFIQEEGLDLAAYPEISEPSLQSLSGIDPDDRFQRVALQIAEFLCFLHHKGWLYNDFKPDHFLIQDDGIQIVDLGLCSPIDPIQGQESRHLYSGTFPFISPERIAGRNYDERSDIFAFGMMLLQLLSPTEDKTLEPTLNNLIHLQTRCTRLRGFWRELIAEMTAIEPSQRIGSTPELWGKLLPKSARKNFLLFPVPGNSSVPPDLEKEQVLFVHSPSRINLSWFENQVLVAAWEKGYPTFLFDFKKVSVERALGDLCSVIADGKPKDIYEAVQILQGMDHPGPIVILFLHAQELDSRQRSLLDFALSYMSAPTSMRIFLFTTESLRERSPGHVQIPLLGKDEIDRMIRTIFPAGSVSSELPAFRKRSYSLPEEILVELQKTLPASGFSAWPAPAKQEVQSVPFERLTPIEKRVLAGLAIAGGPLRKVQLMSLVRNRDFPSLLNRLLLKGYLRQQKDYLVLSSSAKSVLKRYRDTQKKAIATELLKTWPSGEAPEQQFSTAVHAKQFRVAALVSVREGRRANREGPSPSAIRWFWRAFRTGANLHRKLLYRLAKYYLREGRLTRVKKILDFIKRKFRCSFDLAVLYMDLYHRSNHLTEAACLSKRASDVARKKGIEKPQNYFLIRYAGFRILENNLVEGARILNDLLQKKSALPPSQTGLIHHFLGLYHFYRGALKDSVKECKIALTVRHRFHSSSMMNLGVVCIKLSRFERAERCLHKAIRIFSKQGDADRLSYALNNLGILLKQLGRMKEARENYYRSLHLSRLNRNAFMGCAILSNIAMTYAMEGRTDRSIEFNRKAALQARKNNMREMQAAALTNLGLQYAIQGRFRSAVLQLRRAEQIRKELQLNAGLADTYEYLGLTYLFMKRYAKAKLYLNLSSNLFHSCHDSSGEIRSRLYLAMVAIRQNDRDGVGKWLDLPKQPEENTFEKGLHAYVSAAHLLSWKEMDQESCKQSIHEAEIVFRRVPSLFWLAQVYQLKATYLLKLDHYEKAVLSLQSAYNIYSRLGSRAQLTVTKEESLMQLPGNLLDRMAEKLPYRMLVMINEVLAEKRSDEMISKILSTALEFTDMERAVLILNENPPRIFKSVSLDEESTREICEISFSAAESAADSGKPFYCQNAYAHPSMKERPSILANRIVSIVCLPLRVEDRLLGYLYLDSREGVETLVPTETVLLEIFASIIALALNTNMLLEQSLEENEDFRTSLGLKQEFPEIVGNSKQMVDVLRRIHQLLDTKLIVLIQGETGTGKELVARILHYCGKRKNGPFVAVNCSAISESLFESELFGHEKGSFTGATGLRKGLFEEANHGTIFLDEISEIPQSMQAKLLRVLQEGEFRRVGGNRTLTTNARILAATNQSIDQLMKDKLFRKDLYYRIAGAQIHLPALRERKEDIPLLAYCFLKSASALERKKILGFSPEAMELMNRYSWPGNVRQLKNEIERIIALTETQWILPTDFDREIQQSLEIEGSTPGENRTLREMEKEWILERLEANNWNIVQTAQSLGLTRNGLYSKMRLYSIPKKRSHSPHRK